MHIVSVFVYFYISSNLSALLLPCSRYQVHMNVWLSLIEVGFKAYDIFLAELLTGELVALKSELFNLLTSGDLPVMPFLRVSFIVNLLRTECKFLHGFCASRQDKLNVCVLLVCRAVFIRFIVYSVKSIMVSPIQ